MTSAGRLGRVAAGSAVLAALAAVSVRLLPFYLQNLEFTRALEELAREPSNLLKPDEVIRAAVFFIPSGLGAQEGGNILLFTSFGFSPVTAMTFSIIRRMREAIWITVGLLYLAKAEVSVLQYRKQA